MPCVKVVCVYERYGLLTKWRDDVLLAEREILLFFRALSTQRTLKQCHVCVYGACVPVCKDVCYKCV